MKSKMMCAKLALAIFCGAIAIASGTAQAAILVPSDSKASYFVMELENTNDGALEITTRSKPGGDLAHGYKVQDGVHHLIAEWKNSAEEREGPK